MKMQAKVTRRGVARSSSQGFLGPQAVPVSQLCSQRETRGPVPGVLSVSAWWEDRGGQGVALQTAEYCLVFFLVF